MYGCRLVTSAVIERRGIPGEEINRVKEVSICGATQHRPNLKLFMHRKVHSYFFPIGINLTDGGAPIQAVR